ncbi:MAG TPA: hypothetical protein VGT98_14205, partial [Candidatus Elarobacter sp.]|nr:hypothetical protein [Candidatus Elarobacter sp.]
ARSLDGRFQQITARLAILKREAPARARRLRELREERQRQPERFRGDASLDEMSRAIEAAQLPAVRLLENAASPERLVKRLRKAITATRRRRLTLQAAKTVVAFLVFSLGFDRIQQEAEELGADVAKLLGSTAKSTTVVVYLSAAIALFSLDRWLLGPLLERWAERKMIRSEEQGVVDYCIGRLWLEYVLGILEHEFDRLMKFPAPNA